MTPGQMGGAPSAPRKVDVIEIDATHTEDIRDFTEYLFQQLQINPGKAVRGVFSFSGITFKGDVSKIPENPSFMRMLEDKIMEVHAVGMMGDKKEIEVTFNDGKIDVKRTS